jgi:NADH-quinone oxidoreductase subunit N
LPKVGAVAVLVRFVALASPEQESLALLLAVLAIASMFYGNLIALAQDDLKRLLGFSGIAHAGYALDRVCGPGPGRIHGGPLLHHRLPVHGGGLLRRDLPGLDRRREPGLGDLAGLHRRAPLLAVTLGVGIFALAGMPPLRGSWASSPC